MCLQTAIEFNPSYFEVAERMRSLLSSLLKSVPAQGHRFQMVLDGILFSKTPSETSSLGRMPLDKNPPKEGTSFPAVKKKNNEVSHFSP